MTAKNQVKVGPWGPLDTGCGYEFIPNGRISKIHIKTNGCIHSIAFSYINKCGEEYRSITYGGTGGRACEPMNIEKDEEIMELSGTLGIYNGWLVITSLRFKTNKKTCEFGSATNNKFSLPVDTKTGKFAGFHGRHGIYLDSIGAVLESK